MRNTGSAAGRAARGVRMIGPRPIVQLPPLPPVVSAPRTSARGSVRMVACRTCVGLIRARDNASARGDDGAGTRPPPGRLYVTVGGRAGCAIALQRGEGPRVTNARPVVRCEVQRPDGATPDGSLEGSTSRCPMRDHASSGTGPDDSGSRNGKARNHEADRRTGQGAPGVTRKAQVQGV